MLLTRELVLFIWADELYIDKHTLRHSLGMQSGSSPPPRRRKRDVAKGKSGKAYWTGVSSMALQEFVSVQPYSVSNILQETLCGLLSY